MDSKKNLNKKKTSTNQSTNGNVKLDDHQELNDPSFSFEITSSWKPQSSQNQNSNGNKNNNITETKLYKRRWWILFVFSMSSFTNSILYSTFATISIDSVTYFDVSFDWVNALSSVFFIAYIPFSFISGWFLDTFRMRYAVVFGCLLQTVGAWLRYFSCFATNSAFVGVFFGQALCAIAQTFIVGATGLLPTIWFGPKERVISTSIGFMFNSLGIGAGLLIAPYLAPNVDMIQWWLLETSVFATILTILVLIFLQDAPPVSFHD